MCQNSEATHIKLIAGGRTHVVSLDQLSYQISCPSTVCVHERKRDERYKRGSGVPRHDSEEVNLDSMIREVELVRDDFGGSGDGCRIEAGDESYPARHGDGRPFSVPGPVKRVPGILIPVEMGLRYGNHVRCES